MKNELHQKVYLYRRIVLAKLFIDCNYSSNIPLDVIADESFLSKFHFIRLFKKIYAQTPHQYLTSVRIERAKQLLQNNVAISEVCHEVGFESISSFTGLFKRVVRKTPSAYQFEQKRMREEIKTSPLKFIPNCFAEKNGWTLKEQF
jgi:AraC-like DNA-binding protein